MTNAQTEQIKISKQAIIDPAEFHKIWLLNDEKLLQRVKTDLDKADFTAARASIRVLQSGMQFEGWPKARSLSSKTIKFPKLKLPELLEEDPLAHLMTLISGFKRLDFTMKFASATPTTAPKIAREYLESLEIIRPQLRDEICELYCKNKKAFLKFLKKNARISESDLEKLVAWSQPIYPLLITILGFHVPLSLLILFLKWVLDKLCRC